MNATNLKWVLIGAEQLKPEKLFAAGAGKTRQIDGGYHDSYHPDRKTKSSENRLNDRPQKRRERIPEDDENSRKAYQHKDVNSKPFFQITPGRVKYYVLFFSFGHGFVLFGTI